MKSIKGFAMTVLAFAAVACSDDPMDTPPANFGYDLEVTGAVTRSLQGDAHFGVMTDPNGNQGFTIVLGSDTAHYIAVVAKEGTARPLIGTYNVSLPGAQEWSAGLLVTDGDEGLLGAFVAESGRIIIEQSTASVLRGRIEFTATGFLGGDIETEQEIIVTGTFTAKSIANAAASARVLRSLTSSSREGS